MTAGLETFAKVRALHDSATHPGEKAAAAGRMEALARKAGMTVKQAKSKLDTPAPRTQAQSAASAFTDFFNTPEFRAERAERERVRLERAARIIKEYGSEDAVFADTPMEAALRTACEPLLGEGETWMTIHHLDGWGTLSGRNTMPVSVRRAVSEAWPLPATVAAAWAEYEAAEKLSTERYTVNTYADPEAFVNARQYVIEELCNALPARSLNDLRARLSWMDFWANSEINQTPDEERTRLATLRADIERMGARLREEAADVQSGQTREYSPEPEKNPFGTQVSGSPDSGTAPVVQSGHPRRTNADKRRDVLTLLNAEKSGIAPLTDREIARRAGVSPQTVGNIRKAQP